MYYKTFRNKTISHYSTGFLDEYDAVLLNTKHNILKAISKAHLTTTRC